MRTTDGPSAFATDEKACDSACASFGTSVFGVTAGSAAAAGGRGEDPRNRRAGTEADGGAEHRQAKHERRRVRFIAFLCIELDELSSRAGCPPGAPFLRISATTWITGPPQ